VVNSVTDSIDAVLRPCAVGKVSKPVVLRIAIEVSDFHPVRARPEEGTRHQSVDLCGLAFPIDPEADS